MLNQKLEAFKDKVQKDTPAFADRFSEIDREVFGEEALASLEEATNAAVEPLKEQLREEREWRKQQLELQRAKNKQDASAFFLKALAKAVPDYEEIDKDPAFADFMAFPDKVSGIPRIQLFKQAEASGDAARVASFMNEYKGINAPVDNLKDKITPVATNSPSPIQDQGDKMSMAEIDKYYEDVMKGRYRNNQKEMKEMENKVNKALASGDVY
jgi:hypothetical protein